VKIIRAAACALLFASATFAQDAAPCALMSFSAAVNVASIEFANCPATLAGKVVKGDTVTVTIGESVIPASVVDVGGTVFQLVGGATVNSRIISVRPTTAAGTRNFDPADAPEYSGDSASVRFVTGDTTDTAADTDFDVTLANPVSHAEQKAHVGQATATEDASTTTADDTAFEFQYTGAYVVFPPRGDARKKWWDRGVQQEYTVSIDTSNQKAATFTDDNSASAAVYLPRFSTGSLLNRARFGTVATYSRAFHSTAQNFDGKLVFEGWLPFVQVQSLFSKNRYAAPPLSFSAGWGYRDQTTADNHSHGTVFDGAVAYHLYLMDQYRVDFEYLTVVNQLNDRPATTPKTQHTWKASVLMSPQPGSAFSAVFAVENGHSGPVFTQLRQYFVGIGLQQLLDKK
jgi:hypothetical protein